MWCSDSLASFHRRLRDNPVRHRRSNSDECMWFRPCKDTPLAHTPLASCDLCRLFLCNSEIIGVWRARWEKFHLKDKRFRAIVCMSVAIPALSGGKFSSAQHSPEIYLLTFKVRKMPRDLNDNWISCALAWKTFSSSGCTCHYKLKFFFISILKFLFIRSMCWRYHVEAIDADKSCFMPSCIWIFWSPKGNKNKFSQSFCAGTKPKRNSWAR